MPVRDTHPTGGSAAGGGTIDRWSAATSCEEVGEPARPIELVRSLAGEVSLDYSAGTASKVYRPPLFVRLLYWLAFQAPFPYVRNIYALRAAEARRRIAGLLTRFWFGFDAVAPVLEITCDDHGCVYVTRLIEGGRPRDRRRARAFLAAVSRRFATVGLSTWQVNPINPRAPDNLIETPDGSYRIIDLESALVSPILPLGQWLDAIRAGSLPVFDDLFVGKARRYVAARAGQIEALLGADGLRQLEQAIDCYEECAGQWQGAELRLWSRLLRGSGRLLHAGARATGVLRLAAAVRGIARRSQHAAARVDSLVREGIERMRDEGRLGPEQARLAEASLASAETVSVMSHLGAHVAMSVPLRFPLGSVARFLWTLFFRLRAEWQILVGRKDGEAVRRARRVHTLPVMALSLVPGAGAAAYAASGALRRDRPLLGVLLDQAFRWLPLGLYRRLHLSALTCSIACSAAPGRRAPGARRRLPRPADLAAGIRRTAEALAPHSALLAAVLVFNVLALLLTLGAGALTGNVRGNFAEFGPFQTLISLELLLTGLLGQLAFSRFWRRADAASRPDAPAILFWLISGWGFGWLAVDDYLAVHERLGDWLAAHGGAIPFLNNVDDTIVLLYGVLGLGLVYLFYGSLRASRASFALLMLGLFWTGAYMAIDFFARSRLLEGLENPVNAVANAVLLAAYAVKWHEVSSAADSAENPAASVPQGSLARASWGP